MISFPPALQKLIQELSRLPSIGEKTAARLAYNLITKNKELAQSLADSLKAAANSICLCKQCFFLAENDLCSICRNESRDASLICVVEKPMDVIAIERMNEFKGRYHVLHGLWAPLKGQGADTMKITELLNRVKQGQIKEVILATGSTVEGDATALYIARFLSEMGIKVTRPAQGIPKGADLEYADDLTLSRAFSARNVINS
jgi:recombination protein RecR